jgi:uncharacterized protein with FMN-binding domain
MEQTTNTRKKEIATGLAVLAVIIILVLAITLTSKKKTTMALTTSNQSASQASASSNQAAATSTASSSYKDGTYSATGSYDSPGGTESIGVTLTLKSGIVTDSALKSGAADSEAKQYQSQFISGYKKLVVGKPLNSIKLSRVSGSSLTSEGFNEAVSQIEQKAQS